MGRPENDPILIAQEMEQAVDLKIAGKDYRFIAEALGRSVSTAYDRVQKGLSEARRAKADEYITVHLQRYEWQYDQLRQRHVAGEVIEKLSPHLCQVLAAERALLGLDPPKRVDLRSGSEGEDPFAEVARLAREEADADEAGLRDGGV